MFKTCISAIGNTLEIKTCPGDSEKVVFTQIVDDHGEHILVERPSEKFSLYYEIQKYADECDINSIIARYQNGDVNALNKVQGMYGDFINVPSSYRDYLNAAIKAKEIFEQLPASDREKYGSVEAFLMSFDNQPVEKPVEKPIEEEKKDDSEE